MCMICMIVCCICFVQIPRYIITIHELLAHTPHDHVERKSLEFAQSKLEELSQVRTTLIIIWSCEIVIVTSNNAQHEMRSCSYRGLSTQTSITPFTTSKIIWIAIWIEIWILIQKMYPLTRDINCSIQQSASHCCSLFSWFGWLVVFNVPSTARSFRDGTPIYCPLRRTWSSINTPFRPGIEPRAVAWQSITLPLRYASSMVIVQSLLHRNPPNIRIKIIEIAIQIKCLHGTKFPDPDCDLDHNPDKFFPSK